jgi:hypothetical protein
MNADQTKISPRRHGGTEKKLKKFSPRRHGENPTPLKHGGKEEAELKAKS